MGCFSSKPNVDAEQVSTSANRPVVPASLVLSPPAHVPLSTLAPASSTPPTPTPAPQATPSGALPIASSTKAESEPPTSPTSPTRIQFITPTIAPKDPKITASLEPDVLAGVEDIGSQLTKTGNRPVKHGGFSEIWLGTLAPDNQQVAIKSLRAVDVGHANPDSIHAKGRLDKRLRREMNVWMPLNHPHILRCLGFATVDQRPSLVSPWCKEGNAREYLDAHPNCDRKAMVVQVAEGLVYLHDREHPIVHYDVKLPNVLIGDDGGAMLTDFGVAKVVDEYKTGLTTTNPTAITLKYSSPEAVAGEPRNVKSDVYSFACVALEIMSDKGPFHKLRNPPMILLAKSNGNTPNPLDHPNLPEDDPLWALLRRCWSEEADHRPTMLEVLDELHQLGYQG